jgi:hypothetical protein
MQYICEHRHIEMSEHYVRILVYMASAFGWPVRANGQCATYSKVLTIILYILFDLRRKTAKCNNNNHNWLLLSAETIIMRSSNNNLTGIAKIQATIVKWVNYYTGVDGDFMWMASDHNLKSVTRLMITSNTARIVTAKIQVAVVNRVNYTGAHGNHA